MEEESIGGGKERRRKTLWVGGELMVNDEQLQSGQNKCWKKRSEV